MTKDPVSGIIEVTRDVTGDTITYRVSSPESSAVVVIVQPNRENDEATAMFLSRVIDSQFARSMLIEFAQADLHKEGDSSE